MCCVRFNDGSVVNMFFFLGVLFLVGRGWMGGGIATGKRGGGVVVKRKKRRRGVRTSADGFRVDYVVHSLELPIS